jgi:ribonuclease P protein component
VLSNVTRSRFHMSNRFRPGVRLRSRAEFLAVQGTGRRVSARFMTLLGLRNERGHDRLGIVASRRVGGAVARNRAKRRLREAFRHEAPGAGVPSLDVVVIARRELVDAPVASVRSDFRAALDRLRKGVA